MPVPPTYERTLLRMVGYLDGVEYPKGTQLPRARLVELTPTHFMRWFNKVTFDTEDPGDDDNPTARSSSLEFYKKALSHFMPNRLMVWNELSNVGNPTRCTEINHLIKKVKKKEVRKQGVPSRARRPMTHEEFLQTHETLREHGRNREAEPESLDPIWNLGCVACLNFQFHLISRIDDSMNFKINNIQKSAPFPHFLQARLNWSKNVSEERDAPWQLMMPAMKTVYCVYCSMSLWLEIFIERYTHASLTPFVFGFSQDITEENGAKASKTIIQSIFGGNIFKAGNTLIRNEGGSGALGTHSVRKLAATHTRRSGASKDERDIRGRWKGKARVGDRYDDVELPWPDIKVAQMLCVGGACKYVITRESGVSNEFVFEFVVPNIKKRFNADVTLILGTALLYLIFEDEHRVVPRVLRERVLQALHTVSRTPRENPVKRIPVVCTGNDGEVYIDEILSEAAQARGPQEHGPQDADLVTGSINDRPMRDQMRALQSQLQHVKTQIAEIDKRLENDHLASTRQLQTINSNIKRIGLSPARPIRSTTRPPASAALSPHPRTLYELWDEYTNGIGGCKTVRKFNSQERGKVKYKFYRRKKVWDLVSYLTRNGLSHHVSIDRIYQSYGREKSVTQIIRLIQADEKRNYRPPMLQI